MAISVPHPYAATAPDTNDRPLDLPDNDVVQVHKRDNTPVPFDSTKIRGALQKAWQATYLDQNPRILESTSVRQTIDDITAKVEAEILARSTAVRPVQIEEIQDRVEIELMKANEFDVARRYIVYRNERTKLREAQTAPEADVPPVLHVRLPDGSRELLDLDRVQRDIDAACQDLNGVSSDAIMEILVRDVYDDITPEHLRLAQIMAARSLVEQEPAYSFVSARLVLLQLRAEVLPFVCGPALDPGTVEDAVLYQIYFPHYIHKGIELELIHPELARFDLERLARALKPERDRTFQFLGLQTLYDRYFLHSGGIRIELPQAFFMRVAMGLAQEEGAREERAIEFYHLLSSFDFMCSTPTLFNAGTLRPQLSSCFLSTVPDDLASIFKAIKDNALLSKFSGGLGNDWTPVRGLGAHIKGTNGHSQGVVPFLKVANDTAVAVNQCFAPDTWVFTDQGIQSIADIEAGSLVLGQQGIYREVQETMAYAQKGPMVQIEVEHAARDLHVTAGHPFWALQNVPPEQTQQRTQDWLDTAEAIPAWVDAGDIQMGDCVAQVIPKEVVPVPDLQEDDAHLYGMLLGNGHCTPQNAEWSITLHAGADPGVREFVCDYLDQRQIHWQVTDRPDSRTLQIRWSPDTDPGQFVFTREDVYDANGHKRIASRLSHLPPTQTWALIRGLIATAGEVAHGKEIAFCSTSRVLCEGLRYQLLRQGVAASATVRRQPPTDHATKTTLVHDVWIPAVSPLAQMAGVEPQTEYSWFAWRGCLWSRVKSVQATDSCTTVHDMRVEGAASYMTTAALAHNGGKRKGAVCAYLETWHIDINEFLDLRKNTGDERRRTHDMNTACWVPDLFMERVEADEGWTLFSPDETPDLHELVGLPFRERYLHYEAQAQAGQIKVWKRVRALDLWRRMLTMLFETGHPWITFKDPCNLRSPQQHDGMVHSSNLCTEITLNSSADEVAVCNLGSVNLAQHMRDGQVDQAKLQHTVTTAMRMLDNVIDINFYTIPETRNSNLRHRPVGLGIMGFQDALQQLQIPYASRAAVEFADRSMEAVSYYAIRASSDLARERGSYQTFAGSLWSRGILPVDSLDLLDRARNRTLEVDRTQHMDWESLRTRVRQQGMRNSNVMAIAPTATIANICGVSPSIEPTFRNLFVKANMSGDFTVVNEYLVQDLKARGLWDATMVSDLKFYDGSLSAIDRVPEDLKQLYATAFEIDPAWLIEAGARRQKWIDQSQSLNLYVATTSGRQLHDLYTLAWKRGLKTTYYLRTQAATRVEKSTLQGTDGKLNAVPAAPQPDASLSPLPLPAEPQTLYSNLSVQDARACGLDDEDCEACQ